MRLCAVCLTLTSRCTPNTTAPEANNVRSALQDGVCQVVSVDARQYALVCTMCDGLDEVLKVAHLGSSPSKPGLSAFMRWNVDCGAMDQY